MMFENIGQKLKTVAKITLVLGVTVGAVGLLICLINLGDPYTYEKIYYTFGTIGSIALIVGSVINAWLCYGVGESAENSVETLKKQERIEQLLSESKNDNSSTILKKNKATHKWECPSCCNLISKNPCPFCGHTES